MTSRVETSQIRRLPLPSRNPAEYRLLGVVCSQFREVLFPLASTKVSCIWRSADCTRGYKIGLSLHSHTRHSKEKLEFIPAFTEKWPVIQRALDRQYRKSVVPVDFSRAYWTSPLTPKLAYEVEKDQIERKLDLAALVSLTDHDSIQAPSLLRLASETAEVPLSMEWTVPYDCGSVFHLGIHNLPVEHAHDLTQALEQYTRAPSRRRPRNCWQLCIRSRMC